MTKLDADLEEFSHDILPRHRLNVYFASRITHAKLARKLVTEWPEFVWTARWPIYHVGKVPDRPEYARTFWEHDLEDVKKSEVVLCYGELEDTLRGALVEAGMALALSRSVMVVGECDSYGTWQYHPLVHRVESLAMARAALRVMAL